MKILLTNDDGIDSPGISALAESIREIAELTIIAPDKQQSAVGHALTMQKPLRLKKYRKNGEVFGLAVNGTPSDCVKLALSTLLDEKPDVVVSGINHGQNTAINIIYSGTVSAAVEGMLLGIPSIAVSIASHSYKTDCSVAAEYTKKIIEKLNSNIPKNTLLNINVPVLEKEQIKGIKITRQSNNIWKDSYEKRTDPFGRDYYWFAGEFDYKDDDPNSDDKAIENGYVSVTPVHLNLTNRDVLEQISTLEKNI